MAKRAYTANRIFTGEQWLHDMAVVVKDGSITDIIPVKDLQADVSVQSFDGMLAPAFIDLQIYGAGEKLFSVFPNSEALELLRDYCAEGGAAYCMPTVATNTREVMYACIDAVKKYWQQNGKGILGLHMEGPWINPKKRGAHIEQLIHSPSLEEVKELLDYGKGIIRIITLAPEVCSPEIISYIISRGITVSAGHSDASYQQARDAFSNGVTAVTHLFNAMSPLQHREPGLAGAAMDDERVMSSIIPDGYHVDFAAVRIAKKAMRERLFVITDAVTTTSDGPYQHYLEGDKFESAAILSGSALTMSKAVTNLIEQAHIDPAEALRMASLYPATVIGAQNNMGKIALGYDANMVLLNENFEALKIVGTGVE
jgi:N-acetylglucosamine-6-phosphate deacetylase